jgi:hypothetical protein
LIRIAFLLAALFASTSAFAVDAASPHFQTLTIDTWPIIPGSAISSANRTGTSGILSTFSGAQTLNDCIKVGTGSNLVDAGNLCILGPPETAGQLAYFAVNGNTIAGLTLGTNVLSALQTPINNNGGIATLPITAADLAAGAALANLGFTPLNRANNLSDIPNDATALANLGAAASGSNSDITSLNALATLVSSKEGGTGTTTPSLISGSYVNVTGIWPNQQITMSPVTSIIAPGGSVGQIQYNFDTVNFGGFTLAGDCVISGSAITCGFTKGVAFGNLASVSANSSAIAALAGAINTSGGMVTEPIINSVLASMAPHTIKANATATAQTPSDQTFSSILDDAVNSTTQGNVLFRSSSGWANLAPGTAGQFLQTQSSSVLWAPSGAPATIPSRTLLGNFGSSSVASVAVTPTSGFRNRIINGDMNVNQRLNGGAVATNVATYMAADRWTASATQAGWTLTQQADAGVYLYTTQITTPSVASTSSLFYHQRILSSNVYDLANAPVSLQAEIYCDTPQAVAWTADAPSVTDNWASSSSMSNGTFNVTSTPTIYTTTFTPTSATKNGLGVGFTFLGSVGAGKKCQISGVQVEPGASSTPFEHLPLEEELRLCYYFYQKDRDSLNFWFELKVDTQSHSLGFTVIYPGGPMRVAPAITTYIDTSGSDPGNVEDVYTGTIVAPNLAIGVTSFYWDFGIPTAAFGVEPVFTWTANAEL